MHDGTLSCLLFCQYLKLVYNLNTPARSITKMVNTKNYGKLTEDWPVVVYGVRTRM